MRFISAVATSLTLLFALPAAAAPARGAVKTTPRAADPAPASGAAFNMKDLEVSAFVGGEFGDLDGFYLRADGALPIMDLAPNIKLLGVASLGFTHLGASPGGFDVSWNMVRVLGSGRVQMNLAPKLDGWADLGIGFYYGSGKVEAQTIVGFDSFGFPIYGTVTGKSSSGGFTMRFAVGGTYEIDPRYSLCAELGLNPYFGDAETTNFFIGVGAAMKL
jgi:hypothetical protein